MERRAILQTIGAFAGMAVLGIPTAANPPRENERKQEPQSVSSEQLGHDLVGIGENDLLTNEKIGEVLYGIEAETDGDVSVTVLGQSNEGRDIYAAEVGTGDTHVLGIAEQHGHEPFMAEGCIALIGYLGATRRQEIQDICESVTVHVIPRVNPDGLARRQRANHDPDAPNGTTNEGFHTRPDEGEGGWDINRYHWYDWEESTLYQHYPEEYPENPVPEAQYIVDFAKEIDPEWIIDFHRQGPHVDSNGDLIDASLAWPQNSAVDPEPQELSQQVAGLIFDRLPKVGNEECNLTEFLSTSEHAGIAGNGHALGGNGSVLFELSTATRGGIGYRIQKIAEALLVATKATANGDLYNVNPDVVEEIPAEWGTTMNL